jgi:hypothetical protein
MTHTSEHWTDAGTGVSNNATLRRLMFLAKIYFKPRRVAAFNSIDRGNSTDAGFVQTTMATMCKQGLAAHIKGFYVITQKGREYMRAHRVTRCQRMDIEWLYDSNNGRLSA